MADAQVLQEFLAVLGYRVDEASSRKFTDAISSMTKLVEGLGLGIAAAASAVITGVASMASSSEQMAYLSQRVKDSVTNIDAFVFALTKMGVSAPEAVKAVQTFADVMRSSPGDRGLIESLVGKGTPTEQLSKLSDYLQQQTPEMQRILRAQLQRLIPDENFWLGLIRQGIRSGQDEGKAIMKRMGFDPDEFAKQSVLFENSVRDFMFRLNSIWGHVSQTSIDSMTEGVKGLTKLIDENGPEIERRIDEVIKAFIRFGKEVVGVVTDVVGWFNKLTESQKQVVEALIAIAGVFLLGGWSKMIIIGLALAKLLDDYQKFKDTGTSDLGIPWAKLATVLETVVTKLDDLNKATGGWVNWMTAIEVLFAGKILLSAIGFFTTILRYFGLVGAAATTSAGIVTSVFGGAFSLLTKTVGLMGEAFSWLARIASLPAAVLAMFLSPNTSIASQEHEDKILGGTAAERNPQNVIPGTAPSHAEENKKAFFEWLKNLGHEVKGAVFGNEAKADELPENLKQLSQGVSDLNQTLTDSFLNSSVGGALGGTGGLGGGGGGGGGGGKKLDFNDPKVLQSIKYFMSKGWSLIAASGIVANLYAESGLNPDAFNAAGGGNGAMGVAQWRGDRQKQFEKVEGVPLKGSSREQQLDFYNWELHNTESAGGNALQKAGSASEAAEILRSRVQRPGGEDRSGPRRMGYADSLMSSAMPLLSSPGTFNHDASKSANVTQNNNVTINGAADPAGTARALKDTQDQHWRDVTRNFLGALQ